MMVASILLKVTAVMALTVAGTRLARRSRAAERHVLLAAAFVVLLIVPAASIVAPTVRVAVPAVVQEAIAPLDIEPIVDLVSSTPSTDVRVDVPPAALRSSWPSLTKMVVGGWVAGTVLFLVPVVVGLWQVRSIRRSSVPWRCGRAIAEVMGRDGGRHRRIDVRLHESLPGPMTCGLIRPAILLPADAPTWPDEDLRRALVHELEHVRRGDWMTQCLARVVSACYWFHPIVWIAWRQLTLEAERACDDAVILSAPPKAGLSRSLEAGASTSLGAGADSATAYANQLVVLAQRLSASCTEQGRRASQPHLAMANRRDLATRIVALLDARQRRGRAGLVAVRVIGAVATLLAVTISPLRMVAAPTSVSLSQARPAFEVASIKPKGPFRGPAEVGVSFLPGGRVVAVNAPLFLLIDVAYGVSEKQVEMTEVERDLVDEVFDIEAKAGVNGLPETAPKEAREQRLRLMLQTLLADRFKLMLHKEAREMLQYALVVAPGGPRLRPSPPQRACPAGERCGGLSGGPAGGVKGLDVDISELAATLTTFGDRQVLDRTGITGKFDIDLPSWNRSSQVLSSPKDNPNEPAEDSDD